MSTEKIACRDCGLCDIDNGLCSLTKRPVTLDSVRKCKKSIKKTIRESEFNRKG